MELYIEFTRPKKGSVLSYIIRAMQGTPYSHVRLRWINSMGINIVYEASGAGVRFMGPLAQEQRSILITHRFSFNLNQQQYKDLIAICMTYAGISYGVTQLLGIGLANILNLRSNPLSRGADRLVCSELVATVLRDVLGILPKVNLDVVGPKEVFDVLVNTVK